ncbi:MAG: hypothetical protein MZU97_11285 [Bacillus subtilis]|nr:hypothetical protein [Bacillus subtilis]
MSASFYAVFAGVFYVLIGGYDRFFAVLACVLGGLLYSLFRDIITHRRAKAAIFSHLAYTEGEASPDGALRPDARGKLGSNVLLKRAGLFFEDGELDLEAFNQPAFAKRPKDSITVPCGVDFKIFEAAADAKLSLTLYRCELMKNNLPFPPPEGRGDGRPRRRLFRAAGTAATPEPAAVEERKN